MGKSEDPLLHGLFIHHFGNLSRTRGIKLEPDNADWFGIQVEGGIF